MLVTFQSPYGAASAEQVPTLGIPQAVRTTAFGQTNTASFAKWLAWSGFFLAAGVAVGYAFGIERTLRHVETRKKLKAAGG